MGKVIYDQLGAEQKLAVLSQAVRLTGGIDLDQVATEMAATLGLPGMQDIPDAAHPILQSQDHPDAVPPNERAPEPAPEVDQTALDAERAALSIARADEGPSAAEVAAGAVNTPIPESEHPIVQNAEADAAAEAQAAAITAAQEAAAAAEPEPEPEPEPVSDTEPEPEPEPPAEPEAPAPWSEQQPPEPIGDVHPAVETAAGAIVAENADEIAAAYVEVNAALAEYPADEHLLSAKAELEAAGATPVAEEPASE